MRFVDVQRVRFGRGGGSKSFDAMNYITVVHPPVVYTQLFYTLHVSFIICIRILFYEPVSFLCFEESVLINAKRVEGS